jgi:hypothetical protein
MFGKIVFSLAQPPSQEKLIKEIVQFLNKNVKNQEQAENLALVISIQNVTDEQEIKKIK